MQGGYILIKKSFIIILLACSCLYSQEWIHNNLTESEIAVEDFSFHENDVWIAASNSENNSGILKNFKSLFLYHNDSLISFGLDPGSIGPLSKYRNKTAEFFFANIKIVDNTIWLYSLNPRLNIIKIVNDTIYNQNVNIQESYSLLSVNFDKDKRIWLLYFNTPLSEWGFKYKFYYSSENKFLEYETPYLMENIHIRLFQFFNNQKIFITSKKEDKEYKNKLIIIDEKNKCYQYDVKSYNERIDFRYYYNNANFYILDNKGNLYLIDNAGTITVKETSLNSDYCFWFIVFNDIVYYSDREGLFKYELTSDNTSKIEINMGKFISFKNIQLINNQIWGTPGILSSNKDCSTNGNGIRILKIY